MMSEELPRRCYVCGVRPFGLHPDLEEMRLCFECWCQNHDWHWFALCWACPKCCPVDDFHDSVDNSTSF